MKINSLVISIPGFLFLFNIYIKDFPTALKCSDLGDLRVLLIIQNDTSISVVGLCLYLCHSCSSAILNCCGGLVACMD